LFSQLLNPSGKVWIKAGQLSSPAVVKKHDNISISQSLLACRLRRHRPAPFWRCCIRPDGSTSYKIGKAEHSRGNMQASAKGKRLGDIDLGGFGHPHRSGAIDQFQTGAVWHLHEV
jgi:hypothetical protein